MYAAAGPTAHIPERTFLLCKPDAQKQHRHIIGLLDDAGFQIQAKTFTISEATARSIVMTFPAVQLKLAAQNAGEMEGMQQGGRTPGKLGRFTRENAAPEWSNERGVRGVGIAGDATGGGVEDLARSLADFPGATSSMGVKTLAQFSAPNTSPGSQASAGSPADGGLNGRSMRGNADRQSPSRALGQSASRIEEFGSKSQVGGEACRMSTTMSPATSGPPRPRRRGTNRSTLGSSAVNGKNSVMLTALQRMTEEAMETDSYAGMNVRRKSTAPHVVQGGTRSSSPNDPSSNNFSPSHEGALGSSEKRRQQNDARDNASDEDEFEDDDDTLQTRHDAIVQRVRTDSTAHNSIAKSIMELVWNRTSFSSLSFGTEVAKKSRTPSKFPPINSHSHVTPLSNNDPDSRGDSRKQGFQSSQLLSGGDGSAPAGSPTGKTGSVFLVAPPSAVSSLQDTYQNNAHSQVPLGKGHARPAAYFDLMTAQMFIDENVKHLVGGGTCLALELSAPNAIEWLRELVGPEDPAEARKVAPRSIRARLGTDLICNAVHAAASGNEARELIGLVFGFESAKELWSLENPATLGLTEWRNGARRQHLNEAPGAIAAHMSIRPPLTSVHPTSKERASEGDQPPSGSSATSAPTGAGSSMEKLLDGSKTNLGGNHGTGDQPSITSGRTMDRKDGHRGASNSVALTPEKLTLSYYTGVTLPNLQGENAGGAGKTGVDQGEGGEWREDPAQPLDKNGIDAAAAGRFAQEKQTMEFQARLILLREMDVALREQNRKWNTDPYRGSPVSGQGGNTFGTSYRAMYSGVPDSGGVNGPQRPFFFPSTENGNGHMNRQPVLPSRSSLRNNYPQSSSRHTGRTPSFSRPDRRGRTHSNADERGDRERDSSTRLPSPRHYSNSERSGQRLSMAAGTGNGSYDSSQQPMMRTDVFSADTFSQQQQQIGNAVLSPSSQPAVYAHFPQYSSAATKVYRSRTIDEKRKASWNGSNVGQTQLSSNARELNPLELDLNESEKTSSVGNFGRRLPSTAFIGSRNPYSNQMMNTFPRQSFFNGANPGAGASSGVFFMASSSTQMGMPNARMYGSVFNSAPRISDADVNSLLLHPSNLRTIFSMLYPSDRGTIPIRTVMDLYHNSSALQRPWLPNDTQLFEEQVESRSSHGFVDFNSFAEIIMKRIKD